MTTSKTCSIYLITNVVNNKQYVGQTWQSINVRISQHKQSNKCIKLHNAMNKYGRNNFKIELIVSCDNQMTADYLERFWIKTLDTINSGYNLSEGGSSGKKSLETRKKMSLAQKGNKKSAFKRTLETRKKMSLAQLGNKKALGKFKTEEQKQKQRDNPNSGVFKKGIIPWNKGQKNGNS